MRTTQHILFVGADERLHGRKPLPGQTTFLDQPYLTDETIDTIAAAAITDESGFWDGAEVLSTYSRAQAIDDGVLVELPAETCREAGIKFPVAVTHEVYAQCIELTPAAKRACNDVQGRMWDILFMLKDAIRRLEGGTTILYTVRVVIERVRPTPTTLKAVCGPGDDGEGTITIMFPEQD